MKNSGGAQIVPLRFCRNVKVSGNYSNSIQASSMIGSSLQVFNRMQQKNVFSWSLMIAAFAQNGHYREAFGLYEGMRLEQVEANSVTLLHAIGACSSLGELQLGKKLHGWVSANGFSSDLTIQTSLISMYSKCGSVSDARRVFDSMVLKDIVSWNAMNGAYVQNGQIDQSLKHFRQMDLDGVKPNASTYGSIFRGLAASQGLLIDSRLMEQRVISSGYWLNVPVQNALVNFYAKRGDLDSASGIFNRLKMKDVISWSTMISAYNRCGNHREALELYKFMQEEKTVEPNSITFISVIAACTSLKDLTQGKEIHERVVQAGFEADVAVGSVLINMYAKCGSFEEARKAFDKVVKKDLICWNFMLAAYCEGGLWREALEIYAAMDAEPNAITFTNVLIACGSLEDLAAGEEVHNRITRSGVQADLTMETALLSMYLKCRSLDSAFQVFEAMQQKDVIAYNFMLSAYVDLGLDTRAVELYRIMRKSGMEQNNVSLTNVLRACSKLQDLKTGREIHQFISENRIETDSITDAALINMYASCGALEEAKQVFDNAGKGETVLWTAMIASYAQAGRCEQAVDLFNRMLSEDIIPNNITYASVLGACANLGKIAQGRKIHSSLQGTDLELDEIVQNSVLSMYARCGSLEEATMFFSEMQSKDVVSWTAMIAALAHHGRSTRVLELVKEMVLSGTLPDKVTFLNILHACSHAGMLSEGCSSFVSMMFDYGVEPCEEHCRCLIDILARAGRLVEAEELIGEFCCGRFINDHSLAWMVLLAACKVQNNVELGLRAAQHGDSEDHAGAVCTLLGNIYAQSVTDTGQASDKVGCIQR